MNLPAISGAEPCTGSNIDGNFRSGLMLADGAMPIDPATAGPRSLRISPNRFDPTTTSNQSGCCTKCAHRMSMWNWSVRISGIRLAHQREALVPVRHGEGDAVRLGGRRQMLLRPRHRQLERELQDAVDADAGVNTLCCETNSRSVPSNMRPPTDEYSPSVFSRTT